MLKLFYLGVSGFIGTVFRYWMSGLTHRLFDSEFPLGTLSVNLIGSLIIGLFWGMLEFVIVSQEMKLMLFVGLLGSFTTFSTFTLENFNLIRSGEYCFVLINVVVGFFVGIILEFAGYFAGRYLFDIIR